MTEQELELRRLLAHIDRIAAKRFLAEPETPTCWGWADFQESRRDPIGIIQHEARKQKEQK